MSGAPLLAMYDTDAGHAVRDSLRDIARGSGAPNESTRSELRDRVCAAVDELKSAGWPIERIIIRLKQVADEVGFRPRADVSGRDREAVVAELVRLCIDRYYT